MTPPNTETRAEPLTWHYHCPQCARAREIPWDNIELEVVCPDCETAHFPPTPGQDHWAYVGGQTWPREIEDEVVVLRGSACVVPGCYREHATLVPRVPFIKGGRLSVDNMVPACAEHGAGRGEDDYEEWLARFARKEPDTAAAGIVITAASSDVLPVQTFGEVVGIHPIIGRITIPGPFPEGMRLLLAEPFVPGPAARLVFYYEWKLGAGESCRVILGTWPRGDRPDLFQGIRHLKGFATNEHATETGAESSALLEVVLPEPKEELWVAAVWVEAEADRPIISTYYLAATTDVPESDAM